MINYDVYDEAEHPEAELDVITSKPCQFSHICLILNKPFCLVVRQFHFL